MTSPTPEEKLRISDERLESLAAAYGKMSFERSFGEMASAFRELQEYRRSPSRREVLEKAARVADRWADIFPQAGNSIAADIRALAEEEK